MKIVCIVCDGYWDQHQGGAELQLCILGDALAKCGYTVHYVFVDRGTPINPTSLKLHPLWMPLLIRKLCYPYHVLFKRKLYQALDSIGPDIIINRVANGFTGLCARYSLQKHVPMIWHVANVTDLLPWRPSFGRTLVFSYLDRRSMEYGIRHATKIVAQADYQNSMLHKVYGRFADAVVRNFHPYESKPICKTEPVVVAWVANLKPKKQPDQFIELARSLSDISNVQFVMLGRAASGSFQRDLDWKIARTPNLSYRGEVTNDEVNELLRQASVFVNTSIFEGFPNTFIQAWLRKVPVVSLTFDPDDVITKKRLGFHSRNFDQMCADVRRLIGDSRLRDEIGERAQVYAHSEHGIAENTARIIRLIEEL